MSASSLPRDDLSLLSRLERLDASTVFDANKSLRVLPAVSGRSQPAAGCSDQPSRRTRAAICCRSSACSSTAVPVTCLSWPPGDHSTPSPENCLPARQRPRHGRHRHRRLLPRHGDFETHDHADIRARATPRAASAMVMPEINVPLLLGNVTVNPGDIRLGDDDGIVVATEAEMAAAIDKAEAIQFTEDALRSSIAEGVCLFDKLNFDEHVQNLRACGSPARSRSTRDHRDAWPLDFGREDGQQPRAATSVDPPAAAVRCGCWPCLRRGVPG